MSAKFILNCIIDEWGDLDSKAYWPPFTSSEIGELKDYYLPSHKSYGCSLGLRVFVFGITVKWLLLSVSFSVEIKSMVICLEN